MPMSTTLSHLTVAYLTNRRDPCIQWFFDSLHNQCKGDYTNMKVVVIDFYADYVGRRESFAPLAHCPITHIPPKPNVWQGAYRLTTQDYFAAANARNTAICVAPDGYLVFVDDLSVLMPGWLDAVHHAMRHGYVACGSYQKVLGLEVKDGIVVGYRDYPQGRDSRAQYVFTEDPTTCEGCWLFGASFAAPVESLLAVNGLDTDSDSMGGEDYILGLMLKRTGHDLRYCPRMKTLESEERHHGPDKPFKRLIKKVGNPDASHTLFKWVASGDRLKAPNYENLRETRQLVLFENRPFPVIGIPQNHWPDGQPLSEM